MKYIVICFLSALAIACTGSGAERALSAVELFEAGDTAASRKVCDKILADTAAFDNLNSNELCTLATLYVRLGGEADDYAATRCLARAREIAPDSVEAYISNLPPDVAGRIIALDRVGTYLGVPRHVLVGAEDTDSTTATAE